MTKPTDSLGKRSKRFRFGLVLASLSLILAACSGSDTTTSETTAAASEGGDMMGAFGPACGAVPADGEGSFAGMSDDTVATAASNNPLLSTLVSAVTEAELVDTLNSDGPFTVFAPTNDAFEALPPKQLEAVLADKELLTSVLTFHVVGTDYKAEGLGEAKTAASVEGGDLTFGTDGTTVNDVDVICSDVPVANGTVHIIDSVLLPQVALDAIGAMTDGDGEAMEGEVKPTGAGCASVPEDGEGSFAGMSDDPAATAASNNPLLSTLVTAVTEAELVDTLNSDGPFTVFAPTNDAFAAVPEADLTALLADKEQLTDVLTFHVLPEKLSSDELIEAETATTVNGADLTFAADGDALTVNGSASSLCINVPTANATVHIIDSVLLPS